jgi:hypothetical protein
MQTSQLICAVATACFVLGAGQVRATTFDIKVSYYDSYTNAMQRKEAIEANLRHFAEGVYESTNGAHRLGRITVYTDAAYKDNTDVLWVQSCWPNAHVNGRGSKGSRIEHCDDFQGTDLLAGSRYGGYTLMHEWGHFTYALFDEYQNSDNACGEDPGSPCKDDVPIENSVMHNQDRAVAEDGGLGDLNWLNFSTALTNNSASNAHYRSYQASGWEVLTRPVTQDPEELGGNRTYYPDLAQAAPAPGQTPAFEIDTAEGQAAAHAALRIEWKRGSGAPTNVANACVTECVNICVNEYQYDAPFCNNYCTNTHCAATTASSEAETFSAMSARRAARAAPTDYISTLRHIVIDHSAAVSPALLENVKAAVQQVIQNSEQGDVIGILAFANQVSEIAPLTVITDDASRNALIQALNTITVQTDLPYLSRALHRALENIETAMPEEDFISNIYLFAHGYNAEAGLSALAHLSDSDVAVYAFHLGQAESDATRLRLVAENSGGAYYKANNMRALLTRLDDAEMESSPVVDVQVTMGWQAVNGSVDLPFYLDDTLAEVDVSLMYPGAASAFSLAVLDPQQTVYPLNLAEYCEEENDPDYGAETFCNISAANLPAGLWHMRVNATSGEDEVFYAVNALPKNNADTLFGGVNLRSGNHVEQGQAMILEAVVGDNFPITGILVSGEVEHPDGSLALFDFKDDGQAPDLTAQDGIYTAALNTPMSGEYGVMVWFDNRAGTAQSSNKGVNYAPNRQGQTPPSVLQPFARKFMRSAFTEVLVKTPATDYERVMDWAESQFPQLFATPQRQDLGNFSGYQGVRFYPLSGYGLGYLNGELYLYQTDSGITSVGAPAAYLPQASSAGF